MKICAKCLVEKDDELFFSDKTRSDKLSHWCKQCKKSFNLTRKDRAKELARLDYIKNAEVYKERARKFRLEHPEYVSEYYQKNPEVFSEGLHRYKARKKQNGHKPYKRKDVFIRDGGICQICNEGPLEYLGGWHLDHIRPVFQGGPDIFDNVRVTCKSCNLRRPRIIPS